jgi:hypothetical protein
MKSSILPLCLLSGCLFAANTTSASTNLVSTNLVDRILAEAKFQQESSRAKAELQVALNSATLVVNGFVVDSDTSVRASTNQTEISAGQGFVAILIRPQAVLLGKWDAGDLLMSDAPIPSKIDTSVFPFRSEFTNGEHCIFVMKPEKNLSRICQTNVFKEIKVVPTK